MPARPNLEIQPSLASNSDLTSAEKRRDSLAIFSHFQTQINKNETNVRSLQELAAGPRFRFVSRVGASFTNLSTAQTLISETIAANALQSTNIIDFELFGTTYNFSGVADNVTYRVKYGGSVLTLGPISIPSNAQRRMFRIIGWLYGDDTPNNQVFTAKLDITDVAGSFGAGLSNAFATANLTVNSALDQAFNFSIQHTTAHVYIGSALSLYKLGAPIVSA